MKKTILLAIFSLLFLGCAKDKEVDGKKIFRESMDYHDPSNSWENTTLNIHIQEPRTLNPHRYSVVELDNSDNTFRLKRNRDDNISEHIIDKNGSSSVLLNGEIATDTALINKYRLDPSRNIGYRQFYQIFYGLPMSLENRISEIKNTMETTFANQECYKVEIELKEPMFSKDWNLFISKSTKEIIGIEIVTKDKPAEGERLYFEKTITINEIRIPRIRHWHELSDDSYSGTDIIIDILTD
ncbi:hypothetical protein K1F50_17450 [Muricauda oceani]|uniref:Lipoprotein n=1 Tax=Flagellimonas oceani TaxID=2698672 RepID=A0A6G7J000_9FLAO|nr:DUF6503 family protein [Allomuricauda oceani]MBW8244597.1 hypothetical protein [Allomuricauda oceani]QII43772.1 hypothetical protein GVT53_03465 [Allomuricauda oceani]